jgi:hypothetical protein
MTHTNLLVQGLLQLSNARLRPRERILRAAVLRGRRNRCKPNKEMRTYAGRAISVARTLFSRFLLLALTGRRRITRRLQLAGQSLVLGAL